MTALPTHVLKIIEPDRLKYIPQSIQSRLAALKQEEIETWNYNKDTTWCSEIMKDKLDLDESDGSCHKVLCCLQQCEGKLQIMYYLELDRPGFKRAINSAARDHNFIGSDESWIIKFGDKLQYVQSIHAEYADWQAANPDSTLVTRAWSKYELECWMKATGEYGHPGPYDKPKASTAEEGMKLALMGPRDPEYELAGIQIIKVKGIPGGTTMATSAWYSVSMLDEYAQNHKKKNSSLSPWGGKRSKTDPIEMYKKTARRNFIKDDAGPVTLRNKSQRSIGEEA